ELNRWKMAAVGYPLWLWADGPTQVGPVSDSVAGLSVSLRAEVSSLTFRMGDGTVVSCTGAGDEWTEAVEPGAKAPNCGHTYTKPSLPKGSYTVSALTNWAVTWTANGQSGVINVPAGQTTELPVGELQVLVR
ncbi:MAG TPA: Tat pathway signal sequence, partial [Propionibacteriaceae bacterium]|nr:Tat pathway signal sequence [Propionibacteriaceae bacterium]